MTSNLNKTSILCILYVGGVKMGWGRGVNFLGERMGAGGESWKFDIAAATKVPGELVIPNECS